MSRPSAASSNETVIVTTSEMVIDLLRDRLVRSSLKVVRIAVSALVSVDAARLVADDVPVVELDDSLAHLVDHGRVVRGHHDGGVGAVDPVEQLHDADAAGRVEVSGGLV